MQLIAVVTFVVSLFGCVGDQNKACSQETTPPTANDLASDNLAKRNLTEEKAVEYLVESGLNIDEWLAAQPDSPRMKSAESQHRLTRIRFLVANARQAQMLQPTVILVDGIENGKQLLEQMMAQEDARLLWDGSTEELESLPLPDFDRPSTYWQTLDGFCKFNSLTMTPFEKQIRLAKRSDQKPNSHSLLCSQSNGPVWAGLLGTESDESFQQIRIQLMWEPKLRVLNAQFPLAELQIKNEGGSDWGAFNRQATLTASVKDSQTGIQIRLPIRPITNENNEIGNPPNSIEMPYRLIVFAEPTLAKFSNFLEMERPAQIHQGGMASISVTRRERIEDSLRVQIFTKYDPKKMAQAIRSHDTWSQNCEAVLSGSDGVTIRPVSQQQLSQTEYEHLMEYEFDLGKESPKIDDVRTWALEFRTPSGMIEVKDTITLRQGSR